MSVWMKGCVEMDIRKVVVISDTHKDYASLQKIVDRHRQEASLFIFLGDVEQDVRTLLKLYPDLPIRMVRGNCDFGSKLKTVDTVEVGGVKILFCHGHTMMVNSGTSALVEAAKAAGCQIALYGHTHVSYCHYRDGMYVMNPGSPAQPRDGTRSYGIIDITDSGVLPYIVKADDLR